MHLLFIIVLILAVVSVAILLFFVCCPISIVTRLYAMLVNTLAHGVKTR
jgi:hypothetical protein